MSGIPPRLTFSAKDFLEGLRGLTAVEQQVYTRLFLEALAYGPLPYDPRALFAISGYAGSAKDFGIIYCRLKALGKLAEPDEATVRVPEADALIDAAKMRIQPKRQRMSEARKKRWPKDQKSDQNTDQPPLLLRTPQR